MQGCLFASRLKRLSFLLKYKVRKQPTLELLELTLHNLHYVDPFSCDTTDILDCASFLVSASSAFFSQLAANTLGRPDSSVPDSLHSDRVKRQQIAIPPALSAHSFFFLGENKFCQALTYWFDLLLRLVPVRYRRYCGLQRNRFDVHLCICCSTKY